jgi:hypothetical protein
MASHPGRTHTKRGIALARYGSLCDRTGQPDPGCNCDACNRYFDAQERRTVKSTDLTRGAQ